MFYAYLNHKPTLVSKLCIAVLLQIALPSLTNIAFADKPIQSLNLPLSVKGKPAQWNEKTISSYLTAEILADNGKIDVAALLLWTETQSLKIPALFPKIALWSLQSKQFDLTRDVTRVWEDTEPHSIEAQQWNNAALILTNNYSELTSRLKQRYLNQTAPPSQDTLIHLQDLGRALNLNETQHISVYHAITQGLIQYENHSDAQFLFAQLAQQAQLNDIALHHLNKASETNLPNTPNLQAIGTLLKLNPDKAIQAAQEWTLKEALNIEAWRLLGFVYADLGRNNEALNTFNHALSLAPNDTSLLLERMEQYRLLKQPNLFKESLLDAYKAKSSLNQAKHIPVGILMGQLLEEHYLNTEALDTYTFILKQYETLNLALNNKNNQKNSNHLISPETLIILQARLLRLQVKLKDKPTALSALNALLKLYNEQHYTDVSDVNPNPNLSNNTLNITPSLQTLLLQTTLEALKEYGQYDDLYYQQALNLTEDLPKEQIAYEQSIIYDAMNLPDKAESTLRTGLKEFPESPHILNALGYRLIDTPNNFKESLTLLEKAYQLMPNNVAIIDSLGWAYFKNKDMDKALTLLKQAYQLKQDPEIAAHLGEILFITNKTSEAKNIWQEGLKINPNHPVLLNTTQRFKFKQP